MDKVIFKRTVDDNLPQIKDGNTIYYTTDTERLFFGNTEYVKKKDVEVKDIYYATKENDGYATAFNIKEYINHNSILRYVNEDGFFIVDEQLNIGAKVDESGIHAKNIIEFEIVEE